MCLLVPIVGIGLYPKIATQTFDVKTVAVASQVRTALSTVVAQQPNTPLYPRLLVAPQLAVTQTAMGE
jgi:NAD(P)H-quinone oxidoreductase subunit 4